MCIRNLISLPSVKLTGHDLESWKTKPHYNCAPVERNVRPSACMQNLTPFLLAIVYGGLPNGESTVQL
jgi:hypothetical protein